MLDEGCGPPPPFFTPSPLHVIRSHSTTPRPHLRHVTHTYMRIRAHIHGIHAHTHTCTHVKLCSGLVHTRQWHISPDVSPAAKVIVTKCVTHNNNSNKRRLTLESYSLQPTMRSLLITLVIITISSKGVKEIIPTIPSYRRSQHTAEQNNIIIKCHSHRKMPPTNDEHAKLKAVASERSPW